MDKGDALLDIKIEYKCINLKYYLKGIINCRQRAKSRNRTANTETKPSIMKNSVQPKDLSKQQ